MARFTHSVVLDAVPRQWFAGFLRALHDQADEFVDDDEVRLEKASWDPRVESSGLLTVVSDDLGLACEFAVRSVADPATVTADGEARLAEDQSSWLRTTTWTAKADVRTWWQGSGRLDAQAHNKFVWGAVRIEPTRVDAGHWQVSVTTRIRGRSWVRPLAAVALLVAHGKVHRQLAETYRKIGEHWHERVPALVRRDPAEVVAELLREWREPDADDTGAILPP